MNDKQEFFCREYLIDFNGTQAAIRAGYSPDSAGQIAHDLLKKHYVQERLDALKAERIAASKVTAERVIMELARLAFVDIRNVTSFGPDGVILKKDAEINDDHAAAISEVSQTTSEGGGSLRVKMHSKEKALELLCKHLGLFKDDGAANSVQIINLTPNFGERKLEGFKAREKNPPFAETLDTELPAGSSKK